MFLVKSMYQSYLYHDLCVCVSVSINHLRQVSTKELEIKATRAVDEIFGKDSAVSLEELRSENAKQKSVIAELK